MHATNEGPTDGPTHLRESEARLDVRLERHVRQRARQLRVGVRPRGVALARRERTAHAAAALGTMRHLPLRLVRHVGLEAIGAGEVGGGSAAAEAAP